MDLAVLISMVGLGIGVSLGGIIAFLQFRKEVIRYTEEERRSVQNELKELGKDETWVLDLVDKLDKSYDIAMNYREMWRLFLAAGMSAIATALSSGIYGSPSWNPLNVPFLILALTLLLLAYAIYKVWRLMDSLGP